MAQLYLKGVYYDTESQGLWYIDNAGQYQEISTGGGSSYLSYVALLNQSGGADAPVPTEQNNNIDPDAVWEYGSSGYYFMNTNADYVANKIWGISDYDSSTPKQLFPLLAGTSLVGYYQIGFYNNAGKISFQLDTRNPSFVQEDIAGGFNISLPEIRVYQ